MLRDDERWEQGLRESIVTGAELEEGVVLGAGVRTK
jgi:hypothetical protein